KNSADSAAAFLVQRAGSATNVLTVDTLTGSGEVDLGTNNSTIGVLAFNNSGTANQFKIQGVNAAAAQTWTLPLATPTAGNCLTSSTTGAAVTLLWNSCGGGGGTLQTDYAAGTGGTTPHI